MAFKCVICNRGPVAGKNVSHSNKRTPTIFKPNLQKKRIKIGNKTIKGYICSKCLSKYSSV